MKENFRILVAEDEEDISEILQFNLESEGYKVDAVHSAEEALTKKLTDYDLFLLDVMMGRGAEGIMIARKLGKDPKLRELPVLIITGIREQMAFLFPGQAVHPHFVDVDELVEKPVAPKLLLEKVEALLKTAETRKAQSK